MKTTIVVLGVLGVLATFGVEPAAGQTQWESRDLSGGGKEFQLRNDEGAAIILACQLNGVGAGFAFTEPIEPTQRAQVRGVPGARENIAVVPVGDRMLQIAGVRGFDFTLELLRTAPSISVRASGARVTFEVFGSDSVVSECVNEQEVAFGGPSAGARRQQPSPGASGPLR